MTTYLTVWMGAKFSAEYPRLLARGLRKHCTDADRLICISDRDEVPGWEREAPRLSFPPQEALWWHKLQAYMGREGPCVLLDLDNLILKDLRVPIEDPQAIYGPQDYRYPEQCNATLVGFLGEGVVPLRVAARLQERTCKPLGKGVGGPWGGDQNFINEVAPRWRLYPHMVSYLTYALGQPLPADLRGLFWHGETNKPHQRVADAWATKWRDQ